MSGQNRAIALMIGAIFSFTVMDAAVKALTPSIGVLPSLWARYSGQMLLVFFIVLPRLRQVVRTKYPVLQFLRSILLMSATGFFFTGLSLIPLTDAAALMSTNPVLITLGAALFLGESLGLRRIVGIAVALVGAMIIMRPGSDVFSPAAMFPLAAAVCYSGYALLTRRVGSDEDVWTSLFYTGLVGTVLLSLAVPFQWQTPEMGDVYLMGLIALAGTVGQMALIQAFSQGEASMLAPFSYSGLAFAAIWGLVFFDEIPDFWTIVGSVLITCAGLYVWYRETLRNR
ncbi:DMT family transporter [Phaeobacter sp. PT47_59]|uniref:DMT family transporter n=1 Tax=Phaeobacter sp. PT47_59 TaxID=3029979 RepID=UPI00237FDF98|nr:DMT family transporter [Phaeobacter sp. PT47_59]MDE4174886.1 DMT family transporter [Phaeobacter sp. PT47_59]